MKGIVFTELLDHTETVFGPAALEEAIEAVDLPHGCAYTAIGTYPTTELVALVVAVAKNTGTPVPDLLRGFGAHLLRTFARRYPVFFAVPGPLELLAGVDDTIHVEVMKLWPDSELPRFEVLERTDRSIVLRYRSPRCMSPLAEGLIQATLDHWERPGTVRTALESADGSVVRFEVELA
ncbi:MAG: heme NO-binding domain-containing protein [Alphaproteobacteria bacterium]|nr:heme NO-binding domain-containing protein [Alphaproteobacteria bacterium]